MVIKLLSKQIPIFWEAIKVGVQRADEVKKDDLSAYLNELLQALLSDKAQCFVIMTEEKRLVGVLITRILLDKVTAEKYILVQTLYIWEQQTDATWAEGLGVIDKLAKAEKCSYITFTSANPRLWERMGKFGVKETARVFRLKLV